MDDWTIMIVLRLVHILAGVFWVGATLLVAGFLFPTLRSVGPEGGRFMQQLMQRRRLPVYLAASTALTLLSGLVMYGRIVAATNGAWASSRPGLVFGLGGLTAILAAILGGVVAAPLGRRLAKLGQNVQAVAGPPSAEQSAELGRLQARLGLTMRAVATLLAIAVTAMAIARYL